ncbi:MAG: cysteine--tRNA ligase [Candidatus Tectomicrobia bacterium RIFCSPLOWO2_12_FULL_69_37]|nr:MAG: cysteine--tRNA ligase [Candidatus Tectomicrobia bacterium RIFCSPLOWO2_02_FULL_70_19]OGL58892.1 MAG: cysteine--tRNA ligase [Candidatus Tectomicrobia bacterium RIFCSPLOWO2_12_FULL_69_37]
MAVQLYNTLTRRKEPLETLEPGRVKMYVCGVTVYDLCHLGHARAAIVFDVIRRYLGRRGYEVTFVCNFTDVDDKIIARARRLKIPIGELTEQFIGEYYKDMDALGVRRADIAPRATAHIGEMIEMIEDLIEKGAAYPGGGDVYFDISRFPAYGKLSHRNLEELEAGFRVEPGEGKRNPLDFALWKASKPDEPFWESPWGPGRPGWHIECSVMSSRYLGDRFDIHGGGEDLVFPHHENEIAQSEGCFGHDWVRYWIHNGFVRINHEKMSKSKGNFFTIKSVLADTPAEVVRFFLLGTHYRHPVDYSDQVVGEAWRGLDRLYNLLLRLGPSGAGAGGEQARRMKEEADAFRARFAEAMDDDFNTARALGHLFDFARQANSLLLEAGGALPREAAAPAVEVFREVGGVLGLFGHEPEEWFRQARPGAPEEGENGQLGDTQVEELISKRTDARKRKDFKEADRIREELAEAGILLEDGPSGTIWKRRL